LPPNSIFVVLHQHHDRLFPDGLVMDLFTRAGRRPVPPSMRSRS
jgi:hypothetical protein